jgi:LmbE family N-acetylglucosaminyl deacetylase
MTRIVAVTPTLADAVQSAGAALARHAARGDSVFAVCLFSVDGDPDDAAAAETLGLAGVVHVGAPPATARGYEGELGPYQGLRDGDEAPMVAAAGLAIALGRLRPELVLAPLGLSGHVDHRIVDRALEELSVPRLRWVDLPYALTRTPGAPLGAGEQVVVPAGEHMEAKLEACRRLGADAERIAAYAAEEGRRLGADGPVEVLVTHMPPRPDRNGGGAATGGHDAAA